MRKLFLNIEVVLGSILMLFWLIGTSMFVYNVTLETYENWGHSDGPTCLARVGGGEYMKVSCN